MLHKVRMVQIVQFSVMVTLLFIASAVILLVSFFIFFKT